MSKTFYMRHIGNPDLVCSAVIIPAKDEERPYWVKSCGLTYSDDGKSASIYSEGCGLFTGCIGKDILAFWGYDRNGTPMVDIIHKGTENYRGVEICNEYGNL